MTYSETTRRALLAASAAAAPLQHADEGIFGDIAAWHATSREWARARAQLEQLHERLPEQFRECGYDPRGRAAVEQDRCSDEELAFFREFERVWIELGLAEANDRAHDAQERSWEIEARLAAAQPRTAAAALALVELWATDAEDQLGGYMKAVDAADSCENLRRAIAQAKAIAAIGEAAARAA